MFLYNRGLRLVLLSFSLTSCSPLETTTYGSDGGTTQEPQERQPPPITTPSSDAGSSTPLQFPAQLLDLSNWRLTLPIGVVGNPTDIDPPALATFVHDSFFHLTAAKTGVLFQANTGGVTTGGSSYPRSELREMAAGGSTLAAWTPAAGTHTLTLREAITHLPLIKPHLVAGQIHNAASDVIAIRLEGVKLFVDINGADGPILDANYQLGRIFEVKLVASGGSISVFYNGASTPAYTTANSDPGCYFKVGAYPQSNTSTEGNGTAYGEVELYSLQLSHS